MGGTMLSKTLVKKTSSSFLLMGGVVFPHCCLTWDQTIVEVMKIDFPGGSEGKASAYRRETQVQSRIGKI